LTVHLGLGGGRGMDIERCEIEKSKREKREHRRKSSQFGKEKDMDVIVKDNEFQSIIEFQTIYPI
jgi:hypothetical protein